MTELCQSTIGALVSAGIEFAAGVRAPGGQKTVSLEVDDLAEFVADKGLWFARKHGATKEDYLRWVETDGTPQCGFVLNNGQRCRNSVSGGSQREFLDWLNEDAGFCTIHGGECSDEAKAKRWKR